MHDILSVGVFKATQTFDRLLRRSCLIVSSVDPKHHLSAIMALTLQTLTLNSLGSLTNLLRRPDWFLLER